MDARYLEDRIAWASNLTARRIGIETDAFRPSGPNDPLSLRNRFLRLHAAFSASPSGFGQTAAHGNAACYGHFDSAYTRPGDYLVQDGRTFFVAAQEPLQPVLCIRTNRRLTIRRPVAPAGVGGNAYGGLTQDGTTSVLQNWPASVLGMATSGTSHAGLPMDMVLPQWTALLPSIDRITIAAADLVQDEAGMRGIIVSAEHSFLGWRMIIRQASP